MHIGRHRSRSGLRATKYAFVVYGNIGFLCCLLNIVAFDACRRQGMLMGIGAGKELGWKPFLIVNERFLIVVVNKGNGNFLEFVSSGIKGIPNMFVHCPPQDRDRR